jgi:outer membrane protein assembly factor BamA
MDAYMRRGEGAQFALTREVAPQTLMTATANVENGLTLADPVVFCTGFETCDPEAIEVLQQRRWSNSIGVTAIQDRSVGGPNPTGGHQLRGAIDFASPLFLSDDQYLRFLGDGAAYRLLRPGFVLAGRLLVGSFLQGTLGEDEFIPPDRRFYAGGPNSVRGFRRNELGPRVYVQEATLENGEVATTGSPIGAATGGTQMLVSSVELRMPSPIFRQNIRFATFVDAGQVWARGSELESSGLKITPGVGVRVATPVGPIRLDAAYNPYVPLPGRLYLADRTTGELILLPGSYEPPAPTFLNRIRLHIAVGQAF